MTPDQSTYRESGVDIDAMNRGLRGIRDHVRSTYNNCVLTDVGSFGGMFKLDTSGMSEPILVSSIDGVGTKVRVASALGIYNTIGADLVAHCVNDILVQGARPLFFLDYFATARLAPEILGEVVQGVADGCRRASCVLIGGETAEMPGVYEEGEYDLAGCIVGVVDRAQALPRGIIGAGDSVIGLASNGLHTNGYSLARHALFDIAGLMPASRPTELGGRTVGDALLDTHRCYAPSVLPLLGEYRVKAIAHITGGGLYDNIPRVLPPDCAVRLHRASWTVPPIFGLIQKAGSVSVTEMHRVFNMGIGLVLIASTTEAHGIIESLTASGETAMLIGEVCAGSPEVLIQ